jgi:hypothetical protein
VLQISAPYQATVRELSEDLPRCVHCGDPLDLHQPSQERPDRLVGYCEECDSLSLVLDGLVVDLHLHGIEDDARVRFAALRRRRVPAPHLRLSGAPAGRE